MVRSTKLIASALAVLLTVLVSGCASSSPEGGESAASGDGGLTTISYIDAGSACLCSYPRLQAEAQGYFAQQGIEIDNKTSIFNANQLIQAVAQGQADIALTGGTAPLASAAAGKLVKVVAVLGAPAPEQITLNNQTLEKLAQKGVTPESPYQEKLAALKGLKIASAATGSTTDLLFRQILTLGGLKPDSDVTIQPFSDAAAGTAAVKQGASDGLAGFPSQTTGPEADGWGKVFIDIVKDAPEAANIPYIVVAVNPDFLKNQPDAVTKFLKAMTQARDDAKDFSQEHSDALHQKFFASTSDAAWKTGIEAILPVFTGSIVPTQELADNLIKVYNIGKPDPVSVPFEELYDTELVKALPDA
ncbi:MULTISPECIES: ABC transporter substrate-binding protein [Nonomuraea]|uniref:ABC transporter substrate-binding protein n=1 Tax=Nonomuraea ferruginea TaxID=46174 RepID=A0ABT4T9E9_9ACTN|nr:ABC transporter substrate-binding protein [Nonomuraea ferruginea]MDA0646134.1 ABC transporter substrate-binding protein [Nonomuraea ferruginea]